MGHHGRRLQERLRVHAGYRLMGEGENERDVWERGTSEGGDEGKGKGDDEGKGKGDDGKATVLELFHDDWQERYARKRARASSSSEEAVLSEEASSSEHEAAHEAAETWASSWSEAAARSSSWSALGADLGAIWCRRRSKDACSSIRNRGWIFHDCLSNSDPI